MTHRSLGLGLALLVSTGLGLAAAAPPASATAAPTAIAAPAGAPTAVPFAGTPRVGALFTGGSGGRLGRHFCTATVVDSPGHDLLVTAAHCVVVPGSGRVTTGLVFVPGYHDGLSPYGQWTVTRVTADAKWSVHGDPDYDVAFLTVAPQAKGLKLEDAAGSEALGFDTGRGAAAVAVGYPDRTERPVHCGSAALRGFGADQLEFDCAGLPGGTSGGPLLTGTTAGAGGRGTVVGVIGGHQDGGRTSAVSYSPYFGPGIAAVYRAAIRQG
ncbi:trypsin-like serine peptidase [Streptacidiphilus cavernicola]|uniref:Serine protease n=1 Tax=Streptacidiphilus cavernicola TaxID=3342716 RepID=A0ABV6VZM8_9ACTN